MGTRLSIGKSFCYSVTAWLTIVLLLSIVAVAAQAQPVPGGNLDPTEIPKYVIPLVIPPVMKNNGEPDNYDIAIRQFRQQILPGGIWNTITGRQDPYKPTKIWGYGPDQDRPPPVAPSSKSQFNYPSYTIETLANQPFNPDNSINVRWINGLVDERNRFLKHLLPVDQTIHWANPAQECRHGPSRTDCEGISDKFYEGPVPMVTHVHGAHVEPESDGYPEAWWLPAARNIPKNFATSGKLFNDTTGNNPGNLGYADYSYRNDEPATTLWFHDHTLGITRLNVYAGLAGFWLMRGGLYDGGTDFSTGEPAVFPGPAPVAGEGVLDLVTPGNPVRNKIREIPLLIQGRSFNDQGRRLFYPKNRAFFEDVRKDQLNIQFAPVSDINPIWNVEAFFNVIVVNGVSWPTLDVAQDRYRFRILNGCQSRTLNLALFVVNPDGSIGEEIPIYQIGASGGFVSQVVEIKTGFATQLPGDGTIPEPQPAPMPQQALLLSLAERADVIVDFAGLPDGTVVRMVNTAPDFPFDGFQNDIPADPGTTGQVMQFIVDSGLNGAAGSTDGKTTAPEDLILNTPPALGPADNSDQPRRVSLNEVDSASVCVLADSTTEDLLVPINQVSCSSEAPPGAEVVFYGPSIDLVGTVNGSGTSASGNPLKWTAQGVGVQKILSVPAGSVGVWVTENPPLNAIEIWDIYNFTMDAHPIHLHLVGFEVVSRTLFDGTPSPNGSRQAWETGFKDTLIAYPGQITRIKALFDIEGLYVWHCHILEHEDSEMMRPYFVGKGRNKKHKRDKDYDYDDDHDYR